MKKVFIILSLMFLLCSCGRVPKDETKSAITGSGVWLSFYELENMLKSESGFKVEFDNVRENLKKLRIENLYLHTRAFGETLYESKYFPRLKSALLYDYDVFEYIVSECKKENIKIHAWINPYRISATGDINRLDSESPVYKWLNDQESGNDKNVGFADGIYLNPSSDEVKTLVLKEIGELINNYDIDGIHFDDYFYPTQSADFDRESYREYSAKTENPISLGDFRRENVTSLISAVKSTVKTKNRNIIFSVSPTASLENNFENLYADVEYWIKWGLVDEIIPQLYFGFDYPDEAFRFDNLLKNWKTLCAENSDVLLKIGLGCYKAKPTLDADKQEWENNSDIVSRQVEICLSDNKVSGYVFFSYSSLFGQDEEYKSQYQKIKEIGERK